MNFTRFRPTLTISGRERLKKSLERLLNRIMALLEGGFANNRALLHGHRARQTKLLLPASVALPVNCPGLDALSPTPWQANRNRDRRSVRNLYHESRQQVSKAETNQDPERQSK
jgi:hypothetical protein